MANKLSGVLDEIKRIRGCQSERSLAKLLEVAPSTLSHYRAGDRGLSIDRIDVMARLLHADAYELHLYLRTESRYEELSPLRTLSARKMSE